MESKERLADDFAEADAKRKMLKELPTPILQRELHSRDPYDNDVRIRMMSRDGQFRVVAPNARRGDSRVFHNGQLIIERAVKDSLGKPNWIKVAEYPKPSVTNRRGEEPDWAAIALHALLSNADG